MVFIFSLFFYVFFVCVIDTGICIRKSFIDIDGGEVFTYSGEGGRDLRGTPSMPKVF